MQIIRDGFALGQYLQGMFKRLEICLLKPKYEGVCEWRDGHISLKF